jgi:hypothetical protein
MSRVAAAFLITCLFVGPSAAQPSPAPAAAVKPSAAELDAFIERGMKDWRIPGSSIVVVHDGASVYERGFGVPRLEQGRLVVGIGPSPLNAGVLQHWNFDTFRARMGDGREGWTPIGFTPGLDGSVNGLILGSPEMTFTRDRAPAK